MTSRPGTRLIALVGATGVGKTRSALELCRRLGGEIVGADSVQVYRGFDIGSGKPGSRELGDVKHHMLDVIEPDGAIDAAAYAALADRAIGEANARGRIAVVVGGTGLWLRALMRGLVESPPVDHALRRRLEDRWREDAGAACHRELSQVDPDSAQVVHPNDMVRVVRALEYQAQTGRALGQVRRAHALGAPRYDALTICLDQSRDEWEVAIVKRIEAMLAAGWVDEVRGLISRYGREVRPMGSVGYREVAQHLCGEFALEEMRERIQRATRLYGKRQRTWFNSDPTVDLRCAPDSLFEGDVWRRVSAHARGS